MTRPYRSRYRKRCRACRRAGYHGHFTAPPKRRDAACPRCGSDEVADMEAAYQKVEAKRERCKCYGVPHPHRKGTHRMCDHHPLAGQPLDDDDGRHWESVLMNERRTSFT